MRFLPPTAIMSVLLKTVRTLAVRFKQQWSENSARIGFPLQIGSIWWGYSPVFVVALLGFVNTLYFFRQVSSWERQQVTTEFNEASQDRVLVIRREIEYALSTVQDVATYFEASPQIRRREFRKFVEPAVKRHIGIESLQWVPFVIHSEREEFERRARLSFPPYSINERTATGEIVAAGSRDSYLPVLYVQPYQQNRELLGLDLASDISVSTLLARSRNAEELQVSQPINLPGDPGHQTGFMVSVPVIHPMLDLMDGEEELQQPQTGKVRGFAVGIYRIGAIVEQALESLSYAGIDIHLLDATDESRSVELYFHNSRKQTEIDQTEELPRKTGLSYQQTLSIGGRNWQIICTHIRGSYQPDAWSGWIVVVGGLAFTALLTIYVATLVGRARKIRELVDLRTQELSDANSALNKEIMERKATEQELTELNNDLEYRVAVRSSEAERRARDLEQFAYVASHDLKAPLRAIGNLADWISEGLEGKLDEESGEQLALLQDRVQRMNALIEGLLEYSRVGRTEGSNVLVDTRALLEEIIDSLSPPRGFTIKLGKELPEFHTDRLLLGQVFSNLISNSLKHHGGKKGRIRVECRRIRRFYEFSVADDGPGISPEYHKKVFMIFQTLQAKDYGSNTGIGLALVKKIVEEQGGWITLESEPGKGALFRFTWPAEPIVRPEELEPFTFPS
ncbi:MAG: CHASE domain-containing protein [Gammaproteobacteria bacterium]|nr:CHASE domain-containing protein [Gammaproteobacteria bacterium]